MGFGYQESDMEYCSKGQRDGNAIQKPLDEAVIHLASAEERYEKISRGQSFETLDTKAAHHYTSAQSI